MSGNVYFSSAGGSQDNYDYHYQEESEMVLDTNIEADGSVAAANNGVIIQGQDDNLLETMFNGPRQIVTRSLLKQLTETVTKKLTKSIETNITIVKSEYLSGTNDNNQQYLYKEKATDMLNLLKKYAEENNIQGSINHVYDTNGKLWFKARDIALILGYNNTRCPIINFVKNENKIEWQKLLVRENYGTSPPYYQPNAIFIDIEGAYDIMFNSTKEGSKNFYKWLTMKSIENRKTNQTTLQLGQSNDNNNYQINNDIVEIHEDTVNTTSGENAVATLGQMQNNMTTMVLAVSQMQNNMNVLVETNRKLSEFVLAHIEKQSNNNLQVDQPVINTNQPIVNNNQSGKIKINDERVFYILHERHTEAYHLSDRLAKTVNVSRPSFLKNNENLELIFLQRYTVNDNKNMKDSLERLLKRYKITYRLTNKKLWVNINLKDFFMQNQIEL